LFSQRRCCDARPTLGVTRTGRATALLLCGGVFMRSLGSARRIDVGFERSDRFLMAFDLSIAGYDRERGEGFQREALRRVRELPGVAAASMVFPLPMVYENSASSVFIAGK